MKSLLNNLSGLRQTFVLAAIFSCTFFSTAIAQAPLDQAIDHVRKTKDEFSLTNPDLQDLTVTDHYISRQSGATHVYMRQAYRGIGIYQANIGVSISKEGGILAYWNYAKPNISRRTNATAPVITPKDAVVAASSVHGLGAVEGVVQIESATGSDQKQLLSAGNISQEDIPARLMYFEDENQTLRLCWDISILQMDGQHWWNVRVDALTGKVLNENDWMVTCTWEAPHDHDTDCKPASPLDNPLTMAAPAPEAAPLQLYAAPPPNSYNVYAEPLESPNHGARSIVSNPHLLAASPFGWHDTDGVAGPEFTITRGNNVHAQDDQNGNNGNGASPDGTAILDFNFPINLAQQPNTYLDAALTNLFYWNNLIHDVWFMHGFDEVSGNFQETNYSGNGAGSDYVFADGQDGSGTNNANFGTPADGGNPRMQMFLWTGQATTNFTVNSPAGIAGAYTAIQPGGFGPGLPVAPLTGNLTLVDDGTGNPNEGCNALTNGAAVNGNIALVDRGNCTFTNKVLQAQNAGATACIVCNNVAGAPFAMGGNDPAVTIPSVMISLADCNLIKAQLGGGVNVSLSGTAGNINKDGDLDNGIIAHEYAHGISNRLVGGPSNAGCLGNAEQMGEGWSDFVGLVMTIEPGDAGVDGRGIGTFAISQPVTGPGIRPAPYSTSMATNPFTYGDITNAGTISQPHGIGFLWASMLWEMTWLLIDNFGYDPDIANGTAGNNIAMTLVTEGMKLTPCGPGFVDGRDAILAADQAVYNGAHFCLIWQAFAKRGLGFSANQGSANNRSDGSEAFDLPVACQGLPVEWLHISATPNTQDITVDWSVAAEIENTGFEVQRRAPSEVDFAKVDFVETQNEARSQTEYSFLDKDVRPGIRYEYRIRQIDLDGSSSFSETVAATIMPSDHLEVAIVPNPAGDRAEILLNGNLEGRVDLQLFNLVGQVVLEMQLDGEAAQLPIPLSLETVPQGTYFLKVRTETATKTQKLLVQ